MGKEPQDGCGPRKGLLEPSYQQERPESVVIWQPSGQSVDTEVTRGVSVPLELVQPSDVLEP